MDLSQVLLFIGALAGITLMLTIFRTVNNGESLKDNRNALLIMLVIAVLCIAAGAYLRSTQG